MDDAEQAAQQDEAEQAAKQQAAPQNDDDQQQAAPQVQAALVRGASTCEAPRVSRRVPYFGTDGR